MEERIWMQISIQAIYKRFKRPASGVNCQRLKGFTFLEILVVLTLGILLMGMVVPQFFALFSKAHESEFKHLSSVLKMLRNDAVLKSTAYCLLFDLKTQQMMTTEEDESGKCGKDILENPKVLKPHDFPEDLSLSNANLVSDEFFSSGTASDLLEVHINRSGFVSPFFLVYSLLDSSKSWIIESKGIMGKLQLREQ